jgi:chromosome segregation ATPase
LDKDKEYYNKYTDCVSKFEQKKREIEEIRVRFNQDVEDRKLRIAFLNNEKHELNSKVYNKLFI